MSGKRRNSAQKRADDRRRRNLVAGIVVLLVIVAAIILCYRCWYAPRHAAPRPEEEMRDCPPAAAPEREPAEPEKPGRAPETSGPASQEVAEAGEYPVLAFGAAGFDLPRRESDDLMFRDERGRYTMMYDTLYRQAAWVAYLLTRRDVEADGVSRSDDFVPDPLVTARGLPTALPSHYSGSGYDRGHLCPSADRRTSRRENERTFVMSNISPQTPELNRGPWRLLEEQVRRWAVECDSLYVVTGGVLREGLDTLPGGVGIPDYFFKVILTRRGGEFYTAAFVLPNADRFTGGYESYAVSVDEAERRTGIDFFPALPDSVENDVEAALPKSFWFGRGR